MTGKLLVNCPLTGKLLVENSITRNFSVNDTQRETTSSKNIQIYTKSMNTEVSKISV